MTACMWEEIRTEGFYNCMWEENCDRLAVFRACMHQHLSCLFNGWLACEGCPHATAFTRLRDSRLHLWLCCTHGQSVCWTDNYNKTVSERICPHFQYFLSTSHLACILVHRCSGAPVWLGWWILLSTSVTLTRYFSGCCWEFNISALG